jgi:hypothetical protein
MLAAAKFPKGDELAKVIYGHVTSHFKARGGVIEKGETVEDGLVTFSVTGLRSVIIPRKEGWERCQVVLTFARVAAGWKLVCVFDGGVASGLARGAIPNDKAWEDMQKENFERMQAYARTILNEVKELIDGKK